MNAGNIAKAATGLGARALGFLGGPVGAAISIGSSIPLLVDLVRSFMDGGENNVDPAQIKKQRDVVMADLVKQGMSPVEAKAKLDAMLEPFVSGQQALREAEPTSGAEMLLNVGLAGAGILGGRKFGKSQMSKKAKDAPADTVHDAKPAPKAAAKRGDIDDGPEALTDDFDRPKRAGGGDFDQPDLTDDFDGRPDRGFTLGGSDGGIAPIDPQQMEIMAAMQRLRGVPRRPPGMTPRGEDVSSMPLLGFDEGAQRSAIAERAGREAGRRRIDMDTLDATLDQRRAKQLSQMRAQRESALPYVGD
jgi:hypothetical protein